MNLTDKKITFIGAGNIAWHLAQTFEQQDFIVAEVFSRKKNNALALAEKLYRAKVVRNLDFSESESEIFFLCVPDNAFLETLNLLKLPENAFLFHTAGSQDLEILKPFCKNIGVFYPLQTFSKSKPVNFKQIPICIEAENQTVLETINALAYHISDSVHFVRSEQRKILHLSAVFACNFTNHLLTISKSILAQNGLGFDLLHCLITETFQKALHLQPDFSQTGPAIRNDWNTINWHQELLKDSPKESEIYQLITQHIQEFYRERK